MLRAREAIICSAALHQTLETTESPPETKSIRPEYRGRKCLEVFSSSSERLWMPWQLDSAAHEDELAR